MVRLLLGLAYLAIATQTIHAASLPESASTNDALSALEERAPLAADIISPDHSLERRKGGGGRGGGSSSSSGGSSRGSSSSGGSRGSFTSPGGSGRPRSFGRNGNYYGGGAAVPYKAGGRTPKGLVAGALIAPLAVVAIMPGLWLYSAYPYYYNNPYRFYNRTAVNRTDDNNNNRRFVNLIIRQEQQGANETLPVICLCGEDLPCSCDENDDQSYLDDLIGNGSYAALDKSLVTVNDVNGTKTLVLNGTLPPDTTAPDSGAGALSAGQHAGYWALGLGVMYAVFM